MHHTAAFSGATGAAVVLATNPAIVDGVLSIRNNNFFPTQDFNLIMAASMGATLTRSLLDSPTIRQITRPQIQPTTAGLVPIAEPKTADYSDYPFRVASDEELANLVTDTANERVTTIINLQANFRPVPPGRIYTMVFDSTTAAVANAWTTLVSTAQNNLPAGRYGIVGGMYIAANGQGFRFNLEQQKLQPGGVANVAAGGTPPVKQRLGGWGIWGEFDNTALPEVQVLCNAATAVHAVFMDFVKLA